MTNMSAKTSQRNAPAHAAMPAATSDPEAARGSVRGLVASTQAARTSLGVRDACRASVPAPTAAACASEGAGPEGPAVLEDSAV